MNFDDVKKAAEDTLAQVTGDTAPASDSGTSADPNAQTGAGGLLDSVMRDEAKTDAALDAVADAAKKLTGGRFDSQIDAARDTADSKLGEN